MQLAIQGRKIGVAVGKGSSGLDALTWALENENLPGNTIYLLHVSTPQQPVSPAYVEKVRVSDTSIRESQVKGKHAIELCTSLCREKKVNPEVCYVEAESVAKKLVELISELALTKLVLGSSSKDSITRFFRRKPIPKFVKKHAPEFCSVVVTSKGQRVSHKDATVISTATDSTNYIQNNQQEGVSSAQINELEKWQHETLTRAKEYARRCEEATIKLDIALREQELYARRCEEATIKLEIALREQETLRRNLQAETQKRIEAQNAVKEYKRELDSAKEQIEQGRTELLEAVVDLEDVRREMEGESQLRKDAEERAVAERAAKEDAVERAVAERAAKEDAVAALGKLQKQIDQRKQQMRYRVYRWEEMVKATGNFHEDNKLGEGRDGHGAVYKGELHDMKVAIKISSSSSSSMAAPGKAEDGHHASQSVVRQLAFIRHPHVVSPLGVCPEGACIVSEFMSNGSLEDHLARERSSPFPLPWYVRLRICSEIASALLYLHGRPEPIAHHDLKLGNILLDQNYVSKIGDVGVGKLVHNRLGLQKTRSDSTEYTDPEYQRTGVFSCESDVYALGIIILQLLTGRPPIGIVDYVDAAIDRSRLDEVLDKSAGDWPLEKAMELACLALYCAEPRREDRANLEKDVIPILQELAPGRKSEPPPVPFIPSSFICPILQEIMVDPHIAADGHTYELDAIKLWLRDHNTSPMTNLKLPRPNLVPNLALRSAIKEYRDRGLL